MAEEKEKKATEEKNDKALAKKPETGMAVKGKGTLTKSGPKAVAKKDAVGKSVYGEKKFAKKKKRFEREQKQDEFEQKIVDLARVTRVMAGGKRMRFRACVAIGNKKGKVAVGLAKGADVTIAVSKAVAQAKKNIVDVSIVNETIPHEILQKTGAAKILFKPARRGRGVIAGGAVRIILELAGVSNITSKILGTNNKVSIAKCTIEALSNLKKVEKKKAEKPAEKKEAKNDSKKSFADKKTTKESPKKEPKKESAPKSAGEKK